MIKDTAAALMPLYRNLVSEGLDESLEVVSKLLPKNVEWSVDESPCGTDRWTWRVPQRYVVHEAYLELEGKRVVDFKDNPLHLVSYSLPIDQTLTWAELAPHLHFNEKRPNAIPWVFKYYDSTWGFCLAKSVHDKLPRDKKYRAVIRSEFRSGPGLKLGVAVVHPEGGAVPEMGEVVVSAHICHPRQANDNASAVAVGVEVARRLAAKPLPAHSASVRFLFQPETVGTVCYLAGHEELIERFRAGVVLESIGNRNTLAIQHSWPGNARIDAIADSVLKEVAPDHRSFPAWHMFSADEKVLNGPGVGVPSIMLTRAPYPEYHTSDDTLDVLDEGMLKQAADAAEEIVRVAASDYIPKRNFRGPVHLSRHGLWVPYEPDRKAAVANQQTTLYFEGRHSVFEIAQANGLGYWKMRELIERYRAKGLVSVQSIPAPALRP